MRLVNITANPHPAGRRIDLSWQLPELSGMTGVRVVRRTGTYPTGQDEETLVGDIDVAQATTLSDDGLEPLTVYYYMLFPYQGEPPSDFFVDRHNRVAAMATSPEDYAGYMYGLLPVIYRRYDTVVPTDAPPEMPAADRERGQLRRFLDLPGGQLDQLHSMATAARDLHDVGKTAGDLLPLLAGWIGWNTDSKLEFDAQRNEVRNAPALYQTIGLIPTVETTVKRISGWESTTKEFVHNVFLSNRPERLNLWSQLRDSGGAWSRPEAPVSLDFAYEGRASTAIDSNGIRWLFYHTLRKGRWSIWVKTSPTAQLELGLQEELAAGPASALLRDAFAAVGFALTSDGVITAVGSLWRIDDATAGESYVVEPGRDSLTVYRTSAGTEDIAPSRPVTGEAAIEKYPSAVLQGQTLWLFWSAYDEDEGKWRIHVRTRTDGQWSADDVAPETGPFAEGGVVDETAARHRPWAVIDNAGDLWLFWMQNDGQGWRLRYNRRTAAAWGTAVSFPLDGTADPRVETEPHVVIEPAVPDPRIWVFWTRQGQAAAGGRTYSEVAYRVKTGLTLDDLNWSSVATLPRVPVGATYHDREPAALIDGAGGVELFWSSNRETQGWSIWRSRPLDIATNTWEAAERITGGPYSRRDALPVLVGDTTWLIHRSNQALTHESGVYRATETVDGRYAGSTTVDTRNIAKISLRGAYEDFETYTHDTGQAGVRDNDDRYARDTIGLFLTPDTLDEAELDQGIERLTSVLKEFMPVTDRAIFVTPRDLETERVYTYGLPPTPSSRRITETYEDSLTTPPLAEDALAPGEDFSDGLEP